MLKHNMWIGERTQMEEDEARVDRLKADFKFILGETIYKELEEWYDYAISGKWDYVLFVVRRSYILALILEKLTGKKMSISKDTTYLTDSSLVRYTDQIAKFYRQRGFFPAILLCDDILIHGRNVNRVIEDLERNLYISLADMVDEDTIKQDLKDAISIHVYTSNVGVLTLLTRYIHSLQPMRVEPAAFWHELSAKISAIICRSDIANAVYVDNIVISKKSFDKLKNRNELVNTDYQGICEYSFIHINETPEQVVRMISTLRFVEIDDGRSYNAIPYVFIPDCAMDEESIFVNEIKKYLLQSRHQSDYVCQLFNALLFQGKKDKQRGMNEFVEFILSEVVLYELCGDELRKTDSHRKEVAIKLARHFGTDKLDEEYVQAALIDLQINPIFKTINEMEAFVTKCLYDDQRLELFRYDSLAEPRIDNQLKFRLENFFYERGRDSEHKVYNTRKHYRYFESDITNDHIYAEGYALKLLFENLNCRDVVVGLALYLQLMDAGVFSINGVNQYTKGAIKSSQFAKAGEQALLVYPLRLNEFIPFITMAYDYANSMGERPEKHIEDFFKSSEGLRMKELAKENRDNISALRVNSLIGNLRYMGQQPSDWDGDYTVNLGFYDSEKIGDAIGYKNRREQYVSIYKDYLNKNF